MLIFREFLSDLRDHEIARFFLAMLNSILGCLDCDIEITIAKCFEISHFDPEIPDLEVDIRGHINTYYLVYHIHGLYTFKYSYPCNL